MAQHRHILSIREAYIFVLNGMLKSGQRLGRSHLTDIRLCIEYLVDTVQRGQALAHTIACLTQIFGRIDNGIENNEIVNKGSGINRTMVAQNQHTAEPQDDSNQHRTEKLRHRVCQIVAAVDTIESAARIVEQIQETLP